MIVVALQTIMAVMAASSVGMILWTMRRPP